MRASHRDRGTDIGIDWPRTTASRSELELLRQNGILKDIPETRTSLLVLSVVATSRGTAGTTVGASSCVFSYTNEAIAFTVG